MTIFIHPNSLSFLLTAVAALVSVVVVWKYRGAPGSKTLLLSTSGILIWAVCNTGIWMVGSIEGKELFLYLSHAGFYTIVSGLLLFALDIAGYQAYLRPSYILLFLTPAIACMVLVATNPLHNMLINQFRIIYICGFPSLEYNSEPYYLIVLYLIPFLYSLAAIILFIFLYFASDRAGKIRVGLIMLALAIPWLAAVFQLDNNHLPYDLNTSSISFTLTCILLTIAIVRYQALDIIRIARSVIVDNLTDGIIVLDTKNRIVDLNMTARADLELFGQPVVGALATEVFPTEAWKDLHNIMNARKVVEIHLPDTHRHFDVMINPIYRSGLKLQHGGVKPGKIPQVIGRVVTYRDISKYIDLEERLREINNELIEANKVKDRFFSFLAHDLRIPYVSIINESEQLMEGAHDLSCEDVENIAGKIFSISKNGVYFLENLLEWSRSQSGALKLRPTVFSIGKMITEVSGAYYSFAQSKSITIELPQFADDLVLADETTIRFVIRNLLGNAIKYTNANGSISFALTRLDTAFEISINDTGTGIRQEDLPKLFRIDSLLRKSGTHGEAGSGFGLILCHEYVEKNGGQITVSSTYSMGSSFRFTIPAATAHQKPVTIS